MTWVFPTRLFNPSDFTPKIEGASVDGGRALNGDGLFGELSGGGRWSIEFGSIALIRPALVKAWRALSAALENGATPCLVLVADRRHQPFLDPRYTGADRFGLAIWDDGLSPWAPEAIVAAASAETALRQTQIAISYSGGKALEGGEMFSIEHPSKGWRLYQITRPVSQGAGLATFDFRPPLREAVAEGELLNFDSPRCVMRLDGPMDAPLQMGKWSTTQVRFVEAFPAPDVTSSGGSSGGALTSGGALSSGA